MLFDMNFKYTLEQQDRISKLRRMVAANKVLKIGTEDVMLTKFLYSNEWHVESAYESINRFYDFKQQQPDWMAQHPVQFFREHFYYSLSKFIMPKPDREGRIILVFKTVDVFNKFPNYFYDSIEMDDLLFESLLLIPRVQMYGITCICDITGTTTNFLRNLSPTAARLINDKATILPFTKRIIHIIQKGFLLNAAANMVMPFMSKEFKERLVTHDVKNLSKLRDMVGYDSLPTEYGGPSGNILDVSFTYTHLLQNADYLLKLQSYRKRSSEGM